jgi:hypothetical protein
MLFLLSVCFHYIHCRTRRLFSFFFSLLNFVVYFIHDLFSSVCFHSIRLFKKYISTTRITTDIILTLPGRIFPPVFSPSARVITTKTDKTKQINLAPTIMLKSSELHSSLMHFYIAKMSLSLLCSMFFSPLQ